MIILYKTNYYYLNKYRRRRWEFLSSFSCTFSKISIFIELHALFHEKRNARRIPWKNVKRFQCAKSS